MKNMHLFLCLVLIGFSSCKKEEVKPDCFNEYNLIYIDIKARGDVYINRLNLGQLSADDAEFYLKQLDKEGVQRMSDIDCCCWHNIYEQYY